MLISTDILQLPSLARAEGVRERKVIASGNRETPYLGRGEEQTEQVLDSKYLKGLRHIYLTFESYNTASCY